MEVRVEAATSNHRVGLGDVFGSRARNPNSCWCQRFRRHDAADNRAALRDEVENADTPVGLLAYEGVQPIGWTRAVPRLTLPGVVENRALARILDDDPSAWWVTCFVVRREYRGKGVGLQLLRAAVDWAGQNGASVLDGHPVDTNELRSIPAPSAVFTGTLSMFTQGGFTEIGRTYPSRHVMRRPIAVR